jgi:hypothetical protein
MECWLCEQEIEEDEPRYLLAMKKWIHVRCMAELGRLIKSAAISEGGPKL